jgi:MinD-like ATPase involved in chromosome partitioning or flagellar assembly
MARRGRLILIVDPDFDFVEDTRLLLQGERVLTARSLEEAEEIAVGGRVDAAMLGPSFGNEAGVRAAGALLGVDPGICVVLAANVVTNRVLLAAVQTGLADVVDTPLTVRKLEGALRRAGRPAAADVTVDVVVEPAARSAAAAAVESASPSPTPAAPAAAVPVAPAPVPVAAAPAEVSAEELVPVVEETPPPAPPQPWQVVGPLLPPEPLPPPFPPSGGSLQATEAELPPRPAKAPPGPEAAPEVETRVGSFEEGRLIVVMAGKGGSGKSVTATNLALALAFGAGEDAVAIVDADLQFGDVALLLQIDPVRSLAEVAAQVEDLSEARLDALLLRHDSGLRVLPAPLQPGGEQVTPKAVVQVVEKVRRLYRYVVVDTGPVFDDILLNLLDHADDALVVVDMDLPSVKNAKVALDLLRAEGYPMDRLHLVVNRINSKARLDLVELERSLGLRTMAAIPSDRLVPQSVNEGIPVVALSPRSRVARAFNGLARSFLGSAARSSRATTAARGSR